MHQFLSILVLFIKHIVMLSICIFYKCLSLLTHSCSMFCISIPTAVASERNQHCGGEARPKGLKLEARMAELGAPGSWRGAYCRPY